MKMDRLYQITDQNREISGKLHRLIKRNDGFGFFLDPAFLYALENYTSTDLENDLQPFGVSPAESRNILRILVMAELIPKVNLQ